MTQWPSTKGRRVFRALLKIGWTVKTQKGSSHLQLSHPQHGEYTWAFRESEEIGPKMLARIAKRTGLRPSDL
ncbi:MAG: type II toxin-antitoxin system HicA family toxin [Candidatus Korobacteraceae bacterium]